LGEGFSNIELLYSAGDVWKDPKNGEVGFELHHCQASSERHSSKSGSDTGVVEDSNMEDKMSEVSSWEFNHVVFSIDKLNLFIHLWNFYQYLRNYAT